MCKEFMTIKIIQYIYLRIRRGEKERIVYLYKRKSMIFYIYIFIFYFEFNQVFILVYITWEKKFVHYGPILLFLIGFADNGTSL